jgi:hypothetical protein
MALPKGDGEGVGLRPLADQEGPITWNPHQHVLCVAPGQVGMVPPDAHAHTHTHTHSSVHTLFF